MEVENWELELRHLHEIFERESIASLRKINRYFLASGQTMDETFRRHFLETSTHRLDASFTTFLLEQKYRKQTTLSSSLPANGISNGLNSIATDGSCLNGRAMNVKIEDDIDAPIEIDDSEDDEGEKEMSGMQAANDTNGNRMESNESQVLINANDHIGIDLTVENANDNDVKHEPEIESAEDEMADLPIFNFNPNDENETISGDANGSESEMIPYQPTASSSVQSQPNSGVDMRVGHHNFASKAGQKGLSNKYRLINNDGSKKRFKCKRCSFASQYKANLKRHQLIHGGNATKRFKCGQCDYATTRKDDLKSHLRTHAVQKSMGIVRDPIDGTYKCTHCTQRFTEWHALTCHLKKIHKINQYRFNCVHCLRGFERKTEKERHEARCKGRRYECHLCKIYVTNQIGHMQRHMRTHSGARPFKCEICIKCFKRKSNLKCHLNTKHSRINA